MDKPINLTDKEAMQLSVADHELTVADMREILVNLRLENRGLNRDESMKVVMAVHNISLFCIGSLNAILHANELGEKMAEKWNEKK